MRLMQAQLFPYYILEHDPDLVGDGQAAWLSAFRVVHIYHEIGHLAREEEIL